MLINFFREGLIAFSIIFTYQKIQKDFVLNKSFLNFIFILLTFNIFVVIALSIPVLLRIVLSYLISCILVKTTTKKLSIPTLTIAYTFSYLIYTFSFLSTAIIIIRIGLSYDDLIWLNLIIILSLIISFSIPPFLNKHNKINITSLSILLEDKQTKSMLIAVTILFIILFAFMEFSAHIEAASNLYFSWLVILFSASILIAILVLIFLLLKHLHAEKRTHDKLSGDIQTLSTEKTKLQAENTRLCDENQKIQDQLNEMLETYSKLEQDYGDVTSTHHSYRYIVPVLLNMQNKLISQLSNYVSFTTKERAVWIEAYTDEFKQLIAEVKVDMANDYNNTIVTSLRIPDDWESLSSLIHLLLNKSKEANVMISFYSFIRNWDDLNVPKVVFHRLLSNIADNAIKEAAKRFDGEVVIDFKQAKDGCISFEISDNADEFDINILKNLGQRKSSTNGTGDGYAEILEDLEIHQASFYLEEWLDEKIKRKKIIITFDGDNNKFLYSHYREAYLTAELKHLDFDFL